MEEYAQKNSSDAKYVSRLSTILVATIQEAKDRIAQIEYIFCSQLYPDFQSKCQTIQKIYFEARKAAETEWKGKENDFLLQLEKLSSENQRLLEENRAFNLEISKLSDFKAVSKELEEKVSHLERALVEKNEEMCKGKEKVESMASNIVSLEVKLSKKVEEAKEERNVRVKLGQQIDLKSLEILKTGKELEEMNELNKLLSSKLEDLEEKVKMLQESAKGMELNGALLQQVEAKEAELLSEKNKRRDVIAAYKNLKSQYNFLCKRFGLTAENMIRRETKEDESNSLTVDKNQFSSPAIKKVVPNEMIKPKDEHENPEDHKRLKLFQKPSSESPSTSISTEAKSGKKRPVSSWRDTRSHQNRGGLDPHDDFLDTPLENVRENIKKIMKEEVQKDKNFESCSDDETQDLQVNNPGRPKQYIPPPMPGERGYKYVEPVRKKAEREKLKGIECRQCKKFYDAVLNDGDKQNVRCEHHDGASRHRYRYAPPLTPEGFWNIGFESEM